MADLRSKWPRGQAANAGVVDGLEWYMPMRVVLLVCGFERREDGRGYNDGEVRTTTAIFGTIVLC